MSVGEVAATRRFHAEDLLQIRDWLLTQLSQLPADEVVRFEVPDPDEGGGLYGGEALLIDGEQVRHRSYKCWVDLAELLHCRLLTPRIPSDERGRGFVELGFAPLARGGDFHECAPLEPTEKYGMASRFAQIRKAEEPSFAFSLEAALQRVDLGPGARVLDLGVNSGAEFDFMRRVYGAERFALLDLLGIDHSASAIEHARRGFGEAHCRFVQHDINRLGELALGRFDLLLSIGTLHSPGIRESKQLLMTLVQEHLSARGSVVLGFPNCRWEGGEVVYGARAPNYNHPEQSLLFKDVDFCKRYLQQHRFRVSLTGKYYLLLTATPIGQRKE